MKRSGPLKRTAPMKAAKKRRPPTRKGDPKRALKLVKEDCDRLFSLIIRAEGKCQMCGVKCPCEGFPAKHSQGCPLTCSHFVGRTANWTRTYEDNCTCLCFSCHAKVEGNPPFHVEWFVGLRGEAVRQDCQRRGLRTSMEKFPWRDEWTRLVARAKELGIEP